jgi:hypothetical protein
MSVGPPEADATSAPAPKAIELMSSSPAASLLDEAFPAAAFSHLRYATTICTGAKIAFSRTGVKA